MARPIDRAIKPTDDAFFYVIPEYAVVPDQCGLCGHDKRIFNAPKSGYTCGFASIDGQYFCHPNDPNHQDCYTIACRRLHR